MMKNVFRTLKDYFDMIQTIPEHEMHRFDQVYAEPEDVSTKAYYTNHNLEKGVLIFIQRLCRFGNVKMQDFFREQFSNEISFNIVELIG